MKTILYDFRDDLILRAIKQNRDSHAILVFTNRKNLVRAQKIVQREVPFGPLKLVTLEQLTEQCLKVTSPVLRRDLRPFLLWSSLTQDDREWLNIASFRGAQTFTRRFFRLMQEWRDYRLSLSIDWDELYESKLSSDTIQWQQHTWERILAIREAYRKHLTAQNLTDPIFIAELEKPHDLRDYRKILVVNPFRLTPFEHQILELFEEGIVMLKASPGWVRDGGLVPERISFDTLEETITIEVEMIERTDRISLDLALLGRLREDSRAIVVDNQMQTEPVYRLVDTVVLASEMQDPISLDSGYVFFVSMRDIASQLEYRDDDPVPLFPAYLLIRAMECDIFRGLFFNGDFHAELIRKVKNDSIRALPLDLNIFNGISSDFHDEIRALLSLKSMRDLSDYISRIVLRIADYLSEKMLRILLETASIMSRTSTDMKGVQLLDAFLAMLDTKMMHTRRAGGASHLMTLADTDNLPAMGEVLFMNIQEGILPSQNRATYLFTDNQRMKLGLPTADLRRMQEFYRFIALCLSSDKVTLLFRTDNDANLHVSSFAEALMIYRGAKIAKAGDAFAFAGDYAAYLKGLYRTQRTDSDEVEPIRIPLSPMLEDGRLSLSFSGFQTLHLDPAAYCLKHLAGLNPLEITEERGLDNLIFGNLVHEVMQNLFLEFNRMNLQDQDVPIEEHRLNALIERQFDWVMRNRKKFYYRIPCGYSRTYFEHILLPYLRASVADFVVQFAALVQAPSIRHFRFHTECGKPICSMYHNPPLELRYEDEDRSLTLDLHGRIDLLAQDLSSNRFWIFDFKTGTSSGFDKGVSPYQSRFYERILFADETGEPSAHGSYESRYYFVMDSKLLPFSAKTSWATLKVMIENAFYPVVMNDFFTATSRTDARNLPYLDLYGKRGVK